ncbi:hypothetical protein AB0C68_40090 [Streptomyces tendae]|uniref:hypothetical protein n=1 Tax=Streptomyces tendae TaxID=1932 RepID=UPI0033E2C0DD
MDSQAVDSLIPRYNPQGRFIRGWGALPDSGSAGRVIIDTMINLDPLAFDGQETDDDKYLAVATEHAK